MIWLGGCIFVAGVCLGLTLTALDDQTRHAPPTPVPPRGDGRTAEAAPVRPPPVRPAVKAELDALFAEVASRGVWTVADDAFCRRHGIEQPT